MTPRHNTVPVMTTDEEAEAFLDQDLSELDLSQFVPFDFERQFKTARVNMRLPQRLLDAIKAKAAREGVPCQRLIREAIEKSLA